MALRDFLVRYSSETADPRDVPGTELFSIYSDESIDETVAAHVVREGLDAIPDLCWSWEEVTEPTETEPTDALPSEAADYLDLAHDSAPPRDWQPSTRRYVSRDGRIGRPFEISEGALLRAILAPDYRQYQTELGQ